MKSTENMVKKALQTATSNDYNVEYIEEIDNGIQIILKGGLFINCFHTGTIRAQGKLSPQLDRLKLLVETKKPSRKTYNVSDFN